MCWRRVTKLQKTVLLVILYFIIYVLISYAITPETQMTFVGDQLRVGDKYAYIFVVAPHSPVLNDTEGADLFKSCGKCFLTNNKGFLPIVEYDAVLIHAERNLLSEATAFMDPEKRYLLEVSKKCINSKFKKCAQEPLVTSFSSKEVYSLCGLCEALHKRP